MNLWKHIRRGKTTDNDILPYIFKNLFDELWEGLDKEEK